LFRLDLLSSAATPLLFLVYCPTCPTLTTFLWRDITRLRQLLAALWCVAPGSSVIAWYLVVAFSLLPIWTRLLPEFLLFSVLLFLLLFHGPAGSSPALAALLGILRPLVDCWAVHWWPFSRLFLLSRSAFTALAALLGILCGSVVFSPPVCRWAFCGLFLLNSLAFTALAALLSILRGSVVLRPLINCWAVHWWPFSRLFLLSSSALAALLSILRGSVVFSPPVCRWAFCGLFLS
jgi:hypothetical protein